MKQDKKEPKMSPHHEAKRGVLKSLNDEMRRHMGENIRDHLSKPKKVVSVEAPDAKGLKEGLEMASKLAPKMDEMSKAAGGMMKDMHESPRDMDEAAEEHEEHMNEVPEDMTEHMADHDMQDEENDDEMEQLKKHLSGMKKS